MACADLSGLKFMAVSAVFLTFVMPASMAGASEYRFMAVTEIEKGRGGHFYAKAYIDDEPVKVLVDTGASSVALSHEDAEAIGIDTSGLDYKHPASTANGIVYWAKVTLDRVEIDNITIRNVEAAVLPKGASTITLLGMSFLGRLDSFKVEDGILILED